MLKEKINKKQKGITLIALIITIIVMLILVGVTINVALNGGLFDTTREAARQMEEQTIYDQIVGAMKLTQEGKINVKGTYEAAKTILEGQGNTITPISPSSEAEITDTTTSVIFNVQGKNGTYTYTITTENIIIGTDGTVVINDFEIEVTQYNNSYGTSLVQSVTLTITPLIPSNWNAPEYTEDEAAAIVAKEMFGTGTTITTLEQLEVEIYNVYINIDDAKNPLYGLEAATDFNDLSNKLSSKIGKENPSKKDIEAYLLQTLGAPYTTVQEAAADMYEYEAETKKLKINGEEIIEGVTWNNNTASYIIQTNGTYEIELELDGKIGRTTVEITGISYLGKYVKYDSDGDNDLTDEILYRVLYEDGELGQGQGAQIITNDVLEAGNIHLGNNDDTIPEGAVTENLDGDGDLFQERAMYSYNNAVQTLNKKCEELVTLRPGITTGARCVGSDPLDPNEKNATIQYVYESDIQTGAFGNSTSWFKWANGLIRKGIGTLSDVPEEKQRLQDIGILQSTHLYWIAARCYELYTSYCNFGIYTSGTESYESYQMLLQLQPNNGGTRFSASSGLRPVVTLEYGVLLNADTGTGTKENPIILEPLS